MDRLKLLEQINIVSPAVANNNIIPILTDLWFTGDRVMAFNDQIAISAELDTSFTGAASPTLLDLLKTSRSEEVELVSKNNQLLVQASKTSTFKLGLRPKSEFIFEIPAVPKTGSLINKAGEKDFLEAVELCMRSVGTDPSVVEQMGLTLIPDKTANAIHIYSTNDHTLSYSKVLVNTPLKQRVILSADFCRQLLSVSKMRDGRINLYINDDHALVTCDDIILYGRLLRSDTPLEFVGIMDDHLPGFERSGIKAAKLVELPKGLRPVLERAVIIANSKMEPTKTTVTVNDGMIKFFSSSDRGEVNDKLRLPGCSDVSVKLDPVWLKIGAEGADDMMVSDRCAVFATPTNLFMIAANTD